MMGVPASRIEDVCRRRHRVFRDALACVVGSYETADDVVQEAFARAPRRLRHRALLVVLVVAAFAAAAPALGLDRAVVDFLASDPTPEVVTLDARHWFDEVLPESRRPGIATEEMRRVHVFTAASGPRALFMAPARDGYCWSLPGLTGACVHEASRAISPLWTDIPPATASSPEPLLIAGPINAPDAERLVVTFQDGEETEVPFVLVSEPIGAGFFYYEVPRERWERGLRPATLSLHGPGGVLLGEASVVYEEGR